MILKYLILGLVIYGIYRFTVAPRIGSAKNDGVEDEYTDYEEID
jgi:hypothetical protein